MRIKSATGVRFKDATDFMAEKLMERHDISRRDALRLLGETLVRTCIVDEILETSDYLIVKNGGKGNG